MTTELVPFSIEEISSLKELNENEIVNCEVSNKILNELIEKLTEAQDRLETVLKGNLPKIEEIKREKTAILGRIKSLNEEFDELKSIEPITVLERRRNDFKTEGEYISKILNRNIKEEFVNQMKRELKLMITNLSSEGVDKIDQIKTVTIPGCDELNEKLDEAGCDGISIDGKLEKLLGTIFKCQQEIEKKVYPDFEEQEKREKFKDFFMEMINFYFTKRIQIIPVNLPQFSALLLNDLSFAGIFCKINLNNKSQKGNRKLDQQRSEFYSKFLRAQKEEISGLFDDNFSSKSVKKISIFLSRLEKVLKPVLLPCHLINLQFNLINYVHETAWIKLKNLSDIGEDELEGLRVYCEEISGISVKNNLEPFLKFKKKFKTLERIFSSSLIEIINLYHRRELSIGINEAELKHFIAAIFASSPLRNEFMRELEVSVSDYEQDEEYF